MLTALFTALTLPPDVAEVLERRQSGLPGARWRPLEALHVTLAFYGEAPDRQADDLASEQKALDVMVRAVMVLSHAAARSMVARGRGAVLGGIRPETEWRRRSCPSGL